MITVDEFPLKQCAPGCGSCNNQDLSIFGCTSCLNGLTLLDDGRCVCPDGTFMDGNTKQCEPCSFECSTCYNLGPNRCSMCRDGYQFNLGTTNCEEIVLSQGKFSGAAAAAQPPVVQPS